MARVRVLIRASLLTAVIVVHTGCRRTEDKPLYFLAVSPTGCYRLSTISDSGIGLDATHHTIHPRQPSTGSGLFDRCMNMIGQPPRIRGILVHEQRTCKLPARPYSAAAAHFSMSALVLLALSLSSANVGVCSRSAWNVYRRVQKAARQIDHYLSI